MPEIHRTVKNKFRFIGTVNHQPAMRVIYYRHPGFEMRIHLKRIIIVIEEKPFTLSRMNNQPVQTFPLQSFSGTGLKCLNMYLVGRGKCGHKPSFILSLVVLICKRPAVCHRPYLGA